MKNAVILSLATALTLAAGAAQAADAKAGAVVFKKCAACHVATEAKNKVGPHLQGVVGRKVASIADFKYSKPMTEYGADGKVWDDAALKTYLADPKGVVKGTKMAFVGLKKAEDIDNVIEYLKNPAAAQ